MGLIQICKRSSPRFGYVQCDIKVPEVLKEQFASFPQTFNNTDISEHDIEPIMIAYAENEVLMTQPRRLLIFSFILPSCTISTPLLLFYLEPRLVCTEVEYTPVKCFNNFVQSAVIARRHGDENPNSSVVAETIKLLANISYGYQILDRSRHSVTKYVNDEKRPAVINNKTFKRLGISTINLTG